MEKMVIRSTNSDSSAMHVGGCSWGDEEVNVLTQLLMHNPEYQLAKCTGSTFDQTLLTLNLEVR